MMTSKISLWILNYLGWKVEGIEHIRTIKKAILAVAPHTSNWDFVLALFIRKAYNFDSKFLGKSSLFRWPLGGVFRWLGGYPVDRKKNTNMVQQSIDIFNTHNEFILALAPEGTRGGTGRFKSGFYHIAQGADVNIILTTFDFEHRKVIFEPCFELTGKADIDIPKIEQYFAGVKGNNDL